MPGMYAINTVNGMALAGGQLGYPVNGYAPRTLGKSVKIKSHPGPFIRHGSPVCYGHSPARIYKENRSAPRSC